MLGICKQAGKKGWRGHAGGRAQTGAIRQDGPGCHHGRPLEAGAGNNGGDPAGQVDQGEDGQGGQVGLAGL